MSDIRITEGGDDVRVLEDGSDIRIGEEGAGTGTGSASYVFNPFTGTFDLAPLTTFTISDPDDGTEANVQVDSNGDNRLLVDAGVTSVNPNDVVTASTHNTTDTVKASYTVPTDKQLFITSVWASTRTADIIAQLQQDDNPVIDIPVATGANSFGPITFPTETPLGPYAAGVVIEIERIEGLSGLNWSGGWVGYLKDA